MTTPTATIFLPYHALDEVIQRGTRAAQPAATAVVPGTLYSVTDEDARLERSDGTGWALYAPTGGGGSAIAYAEGTWTPTDVSGAGLVFVYAGGLYTQIGRCVVVTAQVIYPTTANGLVASIGGLPLAVAGGNAPLAIGLKATVGASLDLSFHALLGTSRVKMLIGNTDVTNAQLTGANLIFGGVYMTAS